jgi:hypothetical protein
MTLTKWVASLIERSTKVTLPTGGIADGVEVPVEETIERWSEVKLEDGTVIRIKTSVISAVRVPGQYDQLGNPMYVINMTPTIAIFSVPENLRKKVQ